MTKTARGDAVNVNNDAIAEWEQTTLAHIHSLYRPEDVFNADEFGLFYRMKPSSTQTFKTTPRSALAFRKRSKERVTVLIGASATGEKLPLNVIGKSERPRCFGRLRVLPCDYSYSRRAWMTRQLWRQVIEKLEKKMKREKRKVALIVDNVATHKKLLPESFENVTVFYLPPGTTSKSQPMDAGVLSVLFPDFLLHPGVIRAIKSRYRQSLMERHLDMFNRGASFSVSLLECMTMLRAAWQAVPAQLIRNCFEACNIRTIYATEHTEGTVLEDANSEVRELWQKGKAAGCAKQFSAMLGKILTGIVPDELSFDEFVAVDDELLTEPENFELSAVAEQESSEEETEEEEDANEKALQVPTGREAAQICNQLQLYLCLQGANESQLKALDSVLAFVKQKQGEQMKQTALTQFFTPML